MERLLTVQGATKRAPFAANKLQQSVHHTLWNTSSGAVRYHSCLRGYRFRPQAVPQPHSKQCDSFAGALLVRRATARVSKLDGVGVRTVIADAAHGSRCEKRKGQDVQLFLSSPSVARYKLAISNPGQV